MGPVNRASGAKPTPAAAQQSPAAHSPGATITFGAAELVAMVGADAAQGVSLELLEAAAAGLVEQIRPTVESLIAAGAHGALEAARRSAFEEISGGDEREVIAVMTLLYGTHSVIDVTRAAAAAEAAALVDALAQVGLSPTPAVAEAVRRLTAA